MQVRKVKIDGHAMNMVMGICAAAGMASEVEQLLAEAEAVAPELVIDAVSYNTVMKAYAQCGDYPNAVKVLMRMRARGLQPNAITYNSLIDAAARTGEAAAAWEFYRDMVTGGFPGDKYTCSILIKTLSPSPTGDRIRKCLDLLREVGTKCDLKLRTRLYHHILEAALELGDSTILMRSFAQTRQHRVRPTAAACRQLKELADQCTGPSRKALEAAAGDEGVALGSELEEKQAGVHEAPPAAHNHDEAKAGEMRIKPQALVKPQAMQWRPRGSMPEESSWLKDENVLSGTATREKPRPSPAMQWRPRKV
jgi:pentatricopeptide repeat protein